MKKNNNGVLIVMGIILFLIIAPNLKHLGGGMFSIVTTEVCSEGVNNYYSLDGTLADSKSDNELINNGGLFVNGKIGQGLRFDGTGYISFIGINENDSVSFWMNNYSNNLGWQYFFYPSANVLSGNFVSGLNGSIDEIIVGVNIQNLSNIQPCYTTTTYENVTCKEYATSQVPTLSSGCLNYTGTLFPDCSYQILNTTTYIIENNVCKNNLYCVSNCLISSGCYSTNQICIENLKYSCYKFENNKCVEKTDYQTCKVNTANVYDSLDVCKSKINTTSSTSSTSTVTSTTTTKSTIETYEQNDLLSTLTKEVFNIGGFSINAIHLLITLAIVIGILWSTGFFGKRR